MRFQSTLPVWGATAPEEIPEGADAISIHAPRVGSDLEHTKLFYQKSQFQSTLPVWGATEETGDKT